MKWRSSPARPASDTPMIASTLYYATLNPYWNVPQDMVREMVAPKVIEQGASYLTERDYEVFETAGKDAVAVDPTRSTGARSLRASRK